MTDQKSLEMILGTRLVGVSFVLDYIGFQFDNLFLHALATPVVVIEGTTRRFGEAGYRDALCSQIGKGVRSVSSTEERLQVVLDNNNEIIVPLAVDHPHGPEMATLSGTGAASDVFNAWLRKGEALTKH